MIADQLEALVNATDGHKEKQCQPFLDQAVSLLLPRTPNQILMYGREEPNRAGSCDFIVSASYGSDANAERHAYIWEVKSPQTMIFEEDDSKERLRPTKGLIKAETQLGYYVQELQYSPSFRLKYGLDTISEVRAAGIIIGRSDCACTPINGLTPDAQRARERTAFQIRRKLFYQPAGLNLLTWNDLVRWFRFRKL